MKRSLHQRLIEAADNGVCVCVCWGGLGHCLCGGYTFHPLHPLTPPPPEGCWKSQSERRSNHQRRTFLPSPWQQASSGEGAEGSTV